MPGSALAWSARFLRSGASGGVLASCVRFNCLDGVSSIAFYDVCMIAWRQISPEVQASLQDSVETHGTQGVDEPLTRMDSAAITDDFVNVRSSPVISIEGDWVSGLGASLLHGLSILVLHFRYK